MSRPFHRLLPSFPFLALILAFMWPGAARAQFVRERPDMLAATALPGLSQVKPGGSFTVKVRFRVKPGSWYYGPKPGGTIVPAQPATLTFPKGVPFTFGAPKWPATVVHETDLGAGEKDRHRVYMGEKVLLLPVKVKPNAPKKAYSLAVTLNGQVCTPRTCIPLKSTAKFTVTVGAANRAGAATFPAYPNVASTDTPGGAALPSLTAETPAPPLPHSPTPQEGFYVTKSVKVDAPKTPWLWVLLAAFLGGMVMNVMPCVLPVVPIKVYTFLEHAHQDHGRAVRLALAFAAGMIAVFLALGAVMASVRGLWGAQFQSPAFVVTLGAVMFLMALWLLGAFTVPVPQVAGGVRASGGEMAGSFGMGALATLLATPCSGPFLGGAIAWAVSQSARLILLTFTVIGIGMAFPYVLLVAQPKLLKRLPRPGPWMETWKQSCALLMFGVAIYFFSLLPPERHVPFLLFCLALGAGVWVVNRWGGLTAGSAKRGVAGAVALGLAAAGAWGAYARPPASATVPAAAVASASGLEWAPFDVNTLNGWLSGGQTVVVEWTADWCPNCKFIERTVYTRPGVVDRLKGRVKLMRADITRPFPAAESLLQKLGGQSIPFSAVFSGEDPARPVVLRDVYTADQLLTALDRPSSVARRP
jgi:thiol:disulfide interchange protein DsbD